MKTHLIIAVVLAVVLCAFIPTHAQDVGWTIDAYTALHNVSVDLWGVFFEEINHAGVGGLYQEQINNQNFETLIDDYAPWDLVPASSDSPVKTSSNIEVFVGLTQDMPLNMHNPTSLRISTYAPNGQGTVGIYNPGFWGISLVNRTGFTVSFYAASETIQTVKVSLMNNATNAIYATKEVSISNGWKKVTTDLVVKDVNNPNAIFVVSFATATENDHIYFDVFSVMPHDGYMGLQYIRPDLATMVHNLSPSFVRFPGGCYVEGDRLSNRYNWKNALGTVEERTGHWNGVWQYYSEDGLGILEYFEWASTLVDVYGNPTRLIWVVNVGIAHTDSIPTDHLDQWVQDALDSIEFILGDKSTKWGGIRAAMGHPEPFRLDYFAIGNEDCGKPYYNENYQRMYDVLNQNYPELIYIANCNLSGVATTELFDYHVYPTAEWFYENQHFFDSADRNGPAVFNSEYAVQTDAGRGNLRAALSEAVWMTGLERNSDLVIAASYAPLFANVNDYHASPDAINFNSYQTYGSVSYWVQQVFANSFSGLKSRSVQTMSNDLRGTTNISVSATMGISTQMANTQVFVLKIISYNSAPTNLYINLANLAGGVQVPSEVTTIASPDGNLNDVNSFADPLRVAPVFSTIAASSNFTFTAIPYSINCIRIYSTSIELATY